MQRLLVNILCKDIVKSSNLYLELFGFEKQFDSDWFIQLKHPKLNIEMGFLAENNQHLKPPITAGSAVGTYLTLVVEDCDELCEKARKMGLEILTEPKDTFYGQRMFYMKDYDGVVLDISSLMANE